MLDLESSGQAESPQKISPSVGHLIYSFKDIYWVWSRHHQSQGIRQQDTVSALKWSGWFTPETQTLTGFKDLIVQLHPLANQNGETAP